MVSFPNGLAYINDFGLILSHITSSKRLCILHKNCPCFVLDSECLNDFLLYLLKLRKLPFSNVKVIRIFFYINVLNEEMNPKQLFFFFFSGNFFLEHIPLLLPVGATRKSSNKGNNPTNTVS